MTMIWFAAITVVPLTFSLGFLAGTVWRRRASDRTLEGVLGRELLVTRRTEVNAARTASSLN